MEQWGKPMKFTLDCITCYLGQEGEKLYWSVNQRSQTNFLFFHKVIFVTCWNPKLHG